MLHHLKVHTGEVAKIKCNVCLKLYQSKTSYVSHIKNNECYPTDQEEQDMIETIENEGELEQLSKYVSDEEGGEDSEGSDESMEKGEEGGGED